MNNLRAIIIDDEEHASVTLSKLLEWNAPNVEVVDTCSNVDEALSSIEKNRPDLIFLDIEMPIKNGFDLLQEIEQVDFEIVFVTAYDQFAVEAFKQHALAYLLKPVDEEQLKIVIDRAKRQISKPLNEDAIAALFETLSLNQSKFNKVAISTINGLELINIDHIILCSSDGNYTNIHRTNEKPLLVAKTLKEIEVQLSGYSQFVRVHHSHLVNLYFVKRYQKGKGGSLLLENEQIIPVSRSRKDDLLKQF